MVAFCPREGQLFNDAEYISTCIKLGYVIDHSYTLSPSSDQYMKAPYGIICDVQSKVIFRQNNG